VTPSEAWRAQLQSVAAVVIGTSAGGVQALLTLLPALNAACAVPIFIVQHIPRHRPSALASIFAPKCAVPVREAQDKDDIEPGVVYFAPADYHLLVEQRQQLALSVDDPVLFSRPSIDVLFQSAADVYRSQLLGLILTGANEDGAAGLAAVQQAGGLTVVEDPEQAVARAMPAAALQRITPHLVLNLQAIADLLRVLPHRTTL
jgi:two-component system, chemotaxis family, protein-glutamate methylesterase/glutaminase